MAFKLINAAAATPGTTINFDGVACIVRSNDISKTGKHGHAKCRIEAISVIDGKKKVFVTGGHERLECPMIEKHRGQVLSMNEERASLMDLETYETIEINVPEELKNELKADDQVEYWDIEGNKFVKKKI